jgi:hypothetical protein
VPENAAALSFQCTFAYFLPVSVRFQALLALDFRHRYQAIQTMDLATILTFLKSAYA